MMIQYNEQFAVGSRVRIVSLPELQEFKATWKHHHPLTSEQLEHAGTVGAVKSVSFYHGGDVLYELHGVPGIWHECCLRAALETN